MIATVAIPSLFLGGVTGVWTSSSRRTGAMMNSKVFTCSVTFSSFVIIYSSLLEWDGYDMCRAERLSPYPDFLHDKIETFPGGQTGL